MICKTSYRHLDDMHKTAKAINIIGPISFPLCEYINITTVVMTWINNVVAITNNFLE